MNIIDNINDLRIHTRLIIDNVDQHLLLQFINENHKISSKIFSGFRQVSSSLKNIMVKRKIISEAEKSDVFFTGLCMLYLDKFDGLINKIFTQSIKNLKSELPDMINKYGSLAVKIALLSSDKKGVKQLFKYADGNVLPDKSDSQIDNTDDNDINSKETISDNNDESKIIEDIKKTLRNKQHEYHEKTNILKSEIELMKGTIKAKELDIKALKEQLNELKLDYSKSVKLCDRQLRNINSMKNEIISLKDIKKSNEREIKRLTEDQQKQEIQQSEIKVNEVVWKNVINAMIKDKNYENAISFCRSLLNLHPDNCEAHIFLIKLYDSINDCENSIIERINISKIFIQNMTYGSAFSYILEAFEKQPANHEIQNLFKQIINRIDFNNEKTRDKILKKINNLKFRNPVAFKQIRKTLKQQNHHLADMLADNVADIDPNKIFDLHYGSESMHMSINLIIKSIASNEINNVEFIRNALLHLKNRDADFYRSIIKMIAKFDESCKYVLSGKYDPIVVDGSNIAWYNKNDNDKPQIKNILLVRNHLRSVGYFPIYIYIDAALTHQIDRKQQLEKMIADCEVLPADAASCADPLILEKAAFYNCSILTNDRMIEWDPNNKAQKIRFKIIDNETVEIFE